jgi:hypothetical protein
MLKGLKSYFFVFLLIIFFLENTNTAYSQTGEDILMGVGFGIASAGIITALAIKIPDAVIDYDNAGILAHLDSIRNYQKPLNLTTVTKSAFGADVSKDLYGFIKTIDSNKVVMSSEPSIEYKIKYIENVIDLESAAKQAHLRRIKWTAACGGVGAGLIVAYISKHPKGDQGSDKDSEDWKRYLALGAGTALVGVSVAVFTIKTQDEKEWDSYCDNNLKYNKGVSSINLQIQPGVMNMGAVMMSSQIVYTGFSPCITAKLSF